MSTTRDIVCSCCDGAPVLLCVLLARLVLRIEPRLGDGAGVCSGAWIVRGRWRRACVCNLTWQELSGFHCRMSASNGAESNRRSQPEEWPSCSHLSTVEAFLDCAKYTGTTSVLVKDPVLHLAILVIGLFSFLFLAMHGTLGAGSSPEG